MTTLLAIIAKDLRLLWRDKAGLIFLTLAPIMVITVAGFSLANLYGADPTGQTAYDFPVVDEDGGAFGRDLRARLAKDTAITLQELSSRAEAEQRVRDKRAGSALVIPPGTTQALRDGDTAEVVLYTDPVKYLERLNVRIRLLELRDELAAEQRETAARTARSALDRAGEEAQHVREAVAQARRDAEAAQAQARRAQADAVEKLRASVAQSQRQLEAELQAARAAASEQATQAMQRQLDALRAPLRRYLETVQARRGEFEQWIGELRRMAGSRAADIPPPPSFPELPESLARLAGDAALPPLPTPPLPRLTLPRLHIELPPLPTPPPIDVPEFTLPNLPTGRGGLTIAETNLTGGPLHTNTFDQNVPGFSVTFLLLGMLLGVSLGLLDERDWGTLDRLRTLPIARSNVLVGKLLARFAIGVVQMMVLLAVGRLAFGISLGPQPVLLLLPTIGIVFAGCAFGLVVAAVAPTREAVLPLGSIVIVTMAAVGGCWWPIDLEPRWMRNVALAFPTTWAMDAFNDLMIRRRGIEAALRPTAVLLSYGLVYLIIGVTLFRARR
jgi:ABC-type transport system involved in cytochrome c biogenesis permease component